MADTSLSFSTRHSVLSSSGKDDLYSILGGSTALRTAHLQPILWSNFRGKKRHESGHSGHYGDACEFTSIHARFHKLHPPRFFYAERKRYNILSRVSVDLWGNASLLRATVFCRTILRVSRYVYNFWVLIKLRKKIVLEIFEKSLFIRSVFLRSVNYFCCFWRMNDIILKNVPEKVVIFMFPTTKVHASQFEY